MGDPSSASVAIPAAYHQTDFRNQLPINWINHNQQSLRRGRTQQVEVIRAEDRHSLAINTFDLKNVMPD